MSTHAIATKPPTTTHIWDAVARPPATALKQIKGGRLTGMTDVNPQWRYRAMTEVFGPCGQGWKYEIVRTWTEQGTEGQVLAFCEVYLWWRENPGAEWDGPIPGIGGSMLVAKERDGLRTNDEGFKMATTDALSVAMKMLGVAADIYAGLWDGSKYKEEAVQPPIQMPRRLSEVPKVAEHDDTLALLEKSVAEVNAKADAAQVTNSYITQGQLIHMMKVARDNGHGDEDTIKAWLKTQGFSSRKAITQDKYRSICERLSHPTPLVS